MWWYGVWFGGKAWDVAMSSTRSRTVRTAFVTDLETPRIVWVKMRKHGALRPQKPVRLTRDGEVVGSRMGEPPSPLWIHSQDTAACKCGLS